MVMAALDRAPAPGFWHQRLGSIRRGLGVIGLFTVSVITSAALAQTRFPDESDLADDRRRGEETLAGCSVALPSGRDRDSGLAGDYVEDRQGQSFLIAPSATLRETVSDNVTLDNDDTQTDFITTLIPAISFCQNIPRLTMSADYQAELIHYADDSSRNDVFHQANASATATILRERLFLDVNGEFDQDPQSFDGPLTHDSELITGNRTDSARLEISPRFIQELGPLGRSVTRYSFETDQFDENDRDTTRHSGSFRVTSRPAADPYSWIASIQSQRVERAGDEDTEFFDDAFLELGYRVSGGFEVLGRAGVETINRRDGSTDRFAGDYWEAGLRWSDPNTRIEARYGDRFFGDTFTGSVRRDSGPLTLQASYDETQTIPQAGTGVPEGQRELFRQLFGEIPEAEVVIEKRLDGSLTYDTGISEFELRGFRDEEEFRTSGDARERAGVDALWRWSVAPRTKLTPRFTWDQVDDRDGDESEEYGVRLSLSRKLAPNMQAGITLRHQERDDDGDDDDFVENALLLELTRVF